MCVSLLTITNNTVKLLIRHFSDSHIRVSREELNAANYTSIPFQDGSVCNLQIGYCYSGLLRMLTFILGLYCPAWFYAPVALLGKELDVFAY